VTEHDKGRTETAHVLPRFLPDGHHFLYLAVSGDPEKSAIYAADLASTDKKMVLRTGHPVRYVESGGTNTATGRGYLLFVRESTLMAQPFDAGKLETVGFAVPVAERVDVSGDSYAYWDSSPNGTLAYASGGSGTALQMTWYDRSGKAVGTVGQPAAINTPRLSPNGSMVAFDRLDPQGVKSDIWLHDLARGGEQRLTFAGYNHFQVWSPDNLRVAYTSGVIGNSNVRVRAADGTGQEELLESTVRLVQDWTRRPGETGGYLITATLQITNPRTGNDLWALPLSGAKPAGPAVPLLETEFNEWHGRVSPDGRWLAYMSNESIRNEVYVTGFPSRNGRWQVSVNGGLFPVWNPNGRELYFVGRDNKMMAVEIGSASAGGGGAPFQAGIPKPLFDVRMGTSRTRSYDVSRDGRFLIASPVEQTGTVPMTVVLNWQAGLKK
jgi:Tol biopolymer transport system component